MRLTHESPFRGAALSLKLSLRSLCKLQSSNGVLTAQIDRPPQPHAQLGLGRLELLEHARQPHRAMDLQLFLNFYLLSCTY